MFLIVKINALISKAIPSINTITQMISILSTHVSAWVYLLFIAGGATFLQILHMIYRLTLHPLAGFPGPKLAAATNFYGCYHDSQRDSCYVQKIPQLHDKYGMPCGIAIHF